MRSRLIFFSLVITFAMFSGAHLLGQTKSYTPAAAATSPDEEDQENTRGAFLTSRPKTVEKPAKSTATTSPQPQRSRRRPVTTAKSSTSGKSSISGATPAGVTDAETSAKAKKDTSPRKVIIQKMGLGLTLFMRDANGLAVRADPTHEFHKGDRVRVLLETNVDGHLYIFNTTDDGLPVMIYPDPQLDDAGNYLQAHVPLEIPSSVAAEEALRWFRFDATAGIERLYFVFSREPLAGAPIEDDLVKFCGDEKAQCNWHPPAELWAALKKQLGVPSPVVKVKSDGQAQTAVEHQAATRGIGLAKDDPEPSLVMMNVASDSGLLVAQLDLFHR